MNIGRIDASTEVYAVIGSPIRHSFSPSIHNLLAELLGYNMVYGAFEVEREGFKSAIKGAYNLGIKGLNITIPYKQDVIQCLCGIDKLAEQIGAVNTLKYTQEGYYGYNTDAYGLCECFKVRDISLKDKDVIILGAGGAARSAAIMVASQGVNKIYLVNRTKNHADDIAKNIERYYNVCVMTLIYEEIYKISKADICIQTTPKGMSPNCNESPIDDDSFFEKIDVAVDIIFNPWQTIFLRQAERKGCITVNGFDMLFFQAVKAFELWHGIEISQEIRNEAKKCLEVYHIQ